MTTIIANPIYDSVFKFLLEDERVAKVLISALLQKEVVELQMRQHEFSKKTDHRISICRIDFSAKIKDKDGAEHLVLIELQKTWLATETMRFRQYLGTQYSDPRNTLSKDGDRKGFGLPIISIYLLDHRVGDLPEPVVYVRRRYLDYNSNPVVDGVPDPFVESLTHDAIIVQIPLLSGKTRNRLERLLLVFDQDFQVEGNSHLLCIDKSAPWNAEEQLVIDRLLKAAVNSELLREMYIEDEFLSELEQRDTEIMRKEQELQQSKQELQRSKQELQQSKQELQQKDQEIEQKDQVIEQSKQELQQSKQELEQKERMLRSAVAMLREQGMAVGGIAGCLGLTEEEVERILAEVEK